jgi:hypothetical protein
VSARENSGRAGDCLGVAFVEVSFNQSSQACYANSLHKASSCERRTPIYRRPLHLRRP